MLNFKWKVFSNFVAFSEYPNFTYLMKATSSHFGELIYYINSSSKLQSINLPLKQFLYNQYLILLLLQEFDAYCLCTVTFDPKGPKLISKLVYWLLATLRYTYNRSSLSLSTY